MAAEMKAAQAELQAKQQQKMKNIMEERARNGEEIGFMASMQIMKDT